MISQTQFILARRDSMWGGYRIGGIEYKICKQNNVAVYENTTHFVCEMQNGGICVVGSLHCEQVLQTIKNCFWQIYRGLVCDSGKEVVLCPEMMRILKGVSHWIAMDPHGEHDPKIGLCFLGSVGTSKTLTLRAVQKTLGVLNDYRMFPFRGMPELVKQIRDEGNDTALNEMCYGNIFLDDIGYSFEKINRWGNPLSPIDYIIHNRADAHVRMYRDEKPMFYATSNLSPSRMKEVYAHGTVDRICHQLCNVVNFANVTPFRAETARKTMKI